MRVATKRRRGKPNAPCEVGGCGDEMMVVRWCYDDDEDGGVGVVVAARGCGDRVIGKGDLDDDVKSDSGVVKMRYGKSDSVVVKMTRQERWWWMKQRNVKRDISGPCGSLDGAITPPDEGKIVFSHGSKAFQQVRPEFLENRLKILSRAMSSASSAVTYTSVYTDSEPGRPISTHHHRHMILDYVPEPIYPEYIPLEDEHEFPAEEQPLPPVVSPTAESLGYVVESDPEEDPEKYEDDKTDDGPVDYPIDGGEDRDDDDSYSSGDDANDEDEDEEDEDKEDEEEEEEHLALADFAVVVPTVELVSPPEGTEPVIPPPSTDIVTTRAMITIRL
ncbi:hypothetical protein Tco_0163319 [Tanacetum coccineum]